MAANTMKRPLRLVHPRAAAFIAGATLLSFARVGVTQRGADLSNIVFDEVLLSDVEGLPIDFGRPDAQETRKLLGDVERLISSAARLQQAEPKNPELIERLVELGLTYQRLERHEEAVETFDQAIALTIQNGGRRNLEQIPLHEQKTLSLLSLGDLAAIDETEEFIYELKSDTYAPASRQMYYATINLADWNTSAYFLENYRGSTGSGFGRLRSVLPRPSRSIAMPNGDPTIEPGAEAGLEDTGGLQAIFNGAIRGVSRPDIIDPRLRRIDRLYIDFQKSVAEAGNGEFDVAVDVAKRIARLAHITKQEMDYERDNYSYVPDYDGSPAQALRMSPERMDESYDTGRQALEYVVDLMRSAKDSLPPEASAAALLDLGDWHLSYGKAQAARDAYSEAWQTLLDAGFAPQNIDRALATAKPFRIPLFATHLYSRASAGLSPTTNLKYKGYVNIAFSIDEIGNGTQLEFLGSSGEDTERIEQIIETQFRSIKFRPDLRDGRMRPSGRIELRYNYAY